MDRACTWIKQGLAPLHNERGVLGRAADYMLVMPLEGDNLATKLHDQVCPSSPPCRTLGRGHHLHVVLIACMRQAPDPMRRDAM